MSKKPTNRPLTLAEDFLWTVCAYLAQHGHETEVAYATEPPAEVVGIRFEDEVVVPVSVDLRAGRPFVDVNRVKVLRGAAIGPKTVERMKEALLAEHVTCKKARELSRAVEAFNQRQAALSTRVKNTGWGAYNWPYSAVDKNEQYLLRLTTGFELCLPIGALLDRDDIRTQLEEVQEACQNLVTELKNRLLRDYEAKQKSEQGSES